MAKVALKGSERIPVSGARVLGPADPTERLEVTLIVRLNRPEALKRRMARAGGGARMGYLSRGRCARLHGASPGDLAAIRAFARAHQLTVVQEHAARRSVVLAGSVAQFNAAFSVRLQQMSHAGGTYRGRKGVIRLPNKLARIIEAVLGLDNRPQAQPHFRVRPTPGNVNWHGAATSFYPTQIASLYAFPAATGQGQCVAIIELGGGYRPADLQAYFAQLKIAMPQVVAVSVDHGKNDPTGDPNGPDGEVMLDVEVVGAVAPQSKIAVYFAPNTDAGFLNAVTTAAHDSVHKPSVISISWGGSESTWTAQAMTAMDQAFQVAAAMGITVCIAAGDGGSSDGVGDGENHVDFPASSPHAVACGGTSLRVSGSTIASEVVWNDGASAGAGGGGVSTFFALPTWQAGLAATNEQGTRIPLGMRGVPDIAGDADPETGYNVRIDGTNTVIGGTSAVAPLWAALTARLNQLSGSPAGLLSPRLYRNPGALRDITQGSNGAYEASKGWDACTGLGSPNGVQLRKKIA